jgi:16S rRNA (guanine527-N7)-methyltransferase
MRAAGYAGLEMGREQVGQMERYGQWLVDEGQRAGGIGPAEPGRIEKRHLADSLLFAVEIPRGAEHVWDLGSGAGLPGIPLAIGIPETEFVLIDRSGRRADLLRRAVRILDLQNCQVIHGEIDDVPGLADAVVSRASLPPPALAEAAKGHLKEDGVVICAGSWVERPKHPGWTTVEIPAYVLDQPIWLLIMRRE